MDDKRASTTHREDRDRKFARLAIGSGLGGLIGAVLLPLAFAAGTGDAEALTEPALALLGAFPGASAGLQIAGRLRDPQVDWANLRIAGLFGALHGAVLLSLFTVGASVVWTFESPGLLLLRIAAEVFGSGAVLVGRDPKTTGANPELRSELGATVRWLDVSSPAGANSPREER